MFLENEGEEEAERESSKCHSFTSIFQKTDPPPAYAPRLNAMLVQTQHNLTITSDNSPRFKTTLLIIIRRSENDTRLFCSPYSANDGI